MINRDASSCDDTFLTQALTDAPSLFFFLLDALPFLQINCHEFQDVPPERRSNGLNVDSNDAPQCALTEVVCSLFWEVPVEYLCVKAVVCLRILTMEYCIYSFRPTQRFI